MRTKLPQLSNSFYFFSFSCFPASVLYMSPFPSCRKICSFKIKMKAASMGYKRTSVFRHDELTRSENLT